MAFQHQKINNRKNLKYSILLILLLVLLLPGIQKHYGIITETPLTGRFVATAEPDFDSLSVNNWFDASFQEEFDYRLGKNSGFRNSLIRINNQLSYNLYNKANAEGVVVGRNKQLLEEDYIFEYLGEYFIGEEVWIEKAKRLRKVQDTLASLGKTLVVAIEPDKVSYYPDEIPLKYAGIKKKISNYEALKKYFTESGINLLDLNAYFLGLKGKTEFPIFPQCGIHWSYYGAALAADTTLKYLANIMKQELTDLSFIDNPIPEIPRHPDYDAGLALNLLFNINHPKTPDSKLEFTYPAKTDKPAALIIGDSFYFNWLNNNIPGEVFKSCDFWYYNKEITQSDRKQVGVASDRNFGDEINKTDLIIIMVTGRFMHSFAWKFDEQLYQYFYNDPMPTVEYLANDIRSYDVQFRKCYSDAKYKNITLTQRIKDEAEYMILTNPEKYAKKEDIIQTTEMAIKNSPDWLANVTEKAKKNKISVEEQIHRDAVWMYDQKYSAKK